MKKKYLILFSLCGFILTLDQLTKQLVISKMSLGISLPVIPSFLSLNYSTNNGFAFGLLRHAPPNLQEVFFIGLPVFALILIMLIFIKLRDNQILPSVALTTILGGASGNLLDRIQYGHVIDFIDVDLLGVLHIPTFNIADASIIIGVIIMFINTLALERRVGKGA